MQPFVVVVDFVVTLRSFLLKARHHWIEIDSLLVEIVVVAAVAVKIEDEASVAYQWEAKDDAAVGVVVGSMRMVVAAVEEVLVATMDVGLVEVTVIVVAIDVSQATGDERRRNG